MNKAIRYIRLIPRRIEQYGLTSVLFKIFVDTTIVLGVEPYIPDNIRWMAAHEFHTSWKGSQMEMYGLHGYNDRIDSKSFEVLNDFYEIGLDFTGKTVLDVGCGTRGVLPIIKAKEKIGADPTIYKAKTNWCLHDEIDVQYLSEKAEDLSLPSESVDVVCCNNTLNHVQKPDVALAQMHRVLKPGGLLLIEVFIEPKNIAHTDTFNPCQLEKMVSKYFTAVRVKYERLKVRVEIDETMDGKLPMRWGGVFKK